MRLAGADGSSRQPYQLIAGERRLRAARLAGLERVPALLRELDDRGALEMALVENLDREELNPVEEGRALKRLSQDFGQTHDAIAARIGKSRPYVSNAIRLLDLPEPILDLIAHSELTVGQSRPLLALASADAQIAAARAIVERGLTAQRVSGETIRATLERLGIRWQRAKRWITSPDPGYARKKARAIA